MNTPHIVIDVNSGDGQQLTELPTHYNERMPVPGTSKAHHRRSSTLEPHLCNYTVGYGSPLVLSALASDDSATTCCTEAARKVLARRRGQQLRRRARCYDIHPHSPHITIRSRPQSALPQTPSSGPQTSLPPQQDSRRRRGETTVILDT
jgi:hypothetical protein